MMRRRKLLSLTIFCIFNIAYLQGQQTVTTIGGTASGTGGTVTYTVGQTAWNNYSGTGGYLNQGVQQPWEISTATAIENCEDISLVLNVYPNPAGGSFNLKVRSFDQKNLRYRLYDINGLLLQDDKIEGEETEILIQNYSSSLYFLKVINGNQEVKVFKIVKN